MDFIFSRFSLAPGFSRVWRKGRRGSRFNGFGGQHHGRPGRKPLKRLRSPASQDTRLKPGANDMANQLPDAELRPQSDARTNFEP